MFTMGGRVASVLGDTAGGAAAARDAIGDSPAVLATRWNALARSCRTFRVCPVGLAGDGWQAAGASSAPLVKGVAPVPCTGPDAGLQRLPPEWARPSPVDRGAALWGVVSSPPTPNARRRSATSSAGVRGALAFALAALDAAVASARAFSAWSRTTDATGGFNSSWPSCVRVGVGVSVSTAGECLGSVFQGLGPSGSSNTCPRGLRVVTAGCRRVGGVAASGVSRLAV